MARVEVDIDIDDIYWDMSRLEKQEMADKLYDNGYIPVELKQDLDKIENRTPNGASESELDNVLNKIWDNRMFINSNDLEVLIKLAKKGI
jgi:hypothetical protein